LLFVEKSRVRLKSAAPNADVATTEARHPRSRAVRKRRTAHFEPITALSDAAKLRDAGPELFLEALAAVEPVAVAA
jgi:hypothetical protein